MHKWNLNSDRTSISAYKLQCRVKSFLLKMGELMWDEKPLLHCCIKPEITTKTQEHRFRPRPNKSEPYSQTSRTLISHTHITKSLLRKVNIECSSNSCHKLLVAQSSLQNNIHSTIKTLARTKHYKNLQQYFNALLEM